MTKEFIAGQRRFKIVIERDEDEYFVASVPALPGCHTQSKTYAGLMDRIRDAIRLCISTAKTNKKYRERVRQFSYEPTFVGMEDVKV